LRSPISQARDPAEPPLGDAAIFLPRLLLGRAFVLEAAALALEIAVDRVPDVLELLLGRVGGSAKLMLSSSLSRSGA
jgi:hypothetical protein